MCSVVRNAMCVSCTVSLCVVFPRHCLVADSCCAVLYVVCCIMLGVLYCVLCVVLR